MQALGLPTENETLEASHLLKLSFGNPIRPRTKKALSFEGTFLRDLPPVRSRNRQYRRPSRRPSGCETLGVPRQHLCCGLRLLQRKRAPNNVDDRLLMAPLRKDDVSIESTICIPDGFRGWHQKDRTKALPHRELDVRNHSLIYPKGTVREKISSSPLMRTRKEASGEA